MYRNLGDINDNLLETVFELGATIGVSNITSRNVASHCNISTGTIFNYYGTMRGLLDSAAQAFDRYYMDKTIQMVSENMSIEDIWDLMLEQLLSEKNGTLFYISYTNTFGFDPTTNNNRAKEFLEIAKPFFHPKYKKTDNQYLLLWDYITSMAFYYAEKFIQGYLKYDSETQCEIKKKCSMVLSISLQKNNNLSCIKTT